MNKDKKGKQYDYAKIYSYIEKFIEKIPLETFNTSEIENRVDEEFKFPKHKNE